MLKQHNLPCYSQTFFENVFSLVPQVPLYVSGSMWFLLAPLVSVISGVFRCYQGCSCCFVSQEGRRDFHWTGSVGVQFRKRGKWFVGYRRLRTGSYIRTLFRELERGRKIDIHLLSPLLRFHVVCFSFSVTKPPYILLPECYSGDVVGCIDLFPCLFVLLRGCLFIPMLVHLSGTCWRENMTFQFKHQYEAFILKQRYIPGISVKLRNPPPFLKMLSTNII